MDKTKVGVGSGEGGGDGWGGGEGIADNCIWTTIKFLKKVVSFRMKADWEPSDYSYSNSIELFSIH